jgi:hypothetical protein
MKPTAAAAVTAPVTSSALDSRGLSSRTRAPSSSSARGCPTNNGVAAIACRVASWSSGANPVAYELTPETTSSPVTQGPSGRASSSAPAARATPYAMNAPFITSCRGEQYAAEHPTSPSLLTESETKL